MIVVETRTVRGIDYKYTYSDIGRKIMQDRTGDIYDEAYDPLDSDRTYTETDIPIEEPTDEDYAEAGKILMGVEDYAEEES